MKIMKTYMGVTTGSFAGRDDCYPELKRQYYDLDKKEGKEFFLEEFNKHEDEEYFLLEPASYGYIKGIIDTIYEEQQEAKIKEQHDKKVAEKEDLLARLKELEKEGY